MNTFYLQEINIHNLIVISLINIRISYIENKIAETFFHLIESSTITEQFPNFSNSSNHFSESRESDAFGRVLRTNHRTTGKLVSAV